MITSFQQFSSINPPTFVNDKKGLIYLSFQINRYTFIYVLIIKFVSPCQSSNNFIIILPILFYSMFDELESQRRFLLDESVQSAFFQQIGVDKPLGKGEATNEQQPGELRQLQAADKASSAEGSNASAAGPSGSSSNDPAREEQRESSREILSSRSHDSPASTLEFLDCLF